MDKPPDAIRRKIVIYVEGSPEEVARFQEGMQKVILGYPDSVSVPREGSVAWKYSWPKVKKNIASIADPLVMMSQAFIDPVEDTDYFPDLDWSGMNLLYDREE